MYLFWRETSNLGSSYISSHIVAWSHERIYWAMRLALAALHVDYAALRKARTTAQRHKVDAVVTLQTKINLQYSSS